MAKVKNLFDMPLSKVKLYQILDGDGENIGILGTTLGADKVSDFVDEWNEELERLIEADESPDTSVDGLAEFITGKGFSAERLFIEDEFVGCD